MAIRTRAISGRGESDGWIVQITDDFASLGVRVDIAQKIGNKLYKAEPFELVMKEVEQGVSSSPTLVLEGGTSSALINALHNAFTAAGIESEPESYVKGKLEATERHLEDMRTISKVKRAPR